MYPRSMNMVPNFSLGSGLSSGVSHMQVIIFMKINENFKNKVKMIEKKSNTFVIYL